MNQSTEEKNKAVCLDFLERVHNKDDLSAIDEYVSPAITSHDPFPGQKPGPEGVKDTMRIFRKAFPDKQIKVNHIMAENDKIMVELTAFGTHKGEFMAMRPTGNHMEFEEVLILRLENGKIVEHWAVADALSLMRQVGAVPA